MPVDEREQRNAIFGQNNSNAQQIQSVDRVKSELGLEVPVETVPLPSQGKVYSENSSLYQKETVDIKAMTTKEEDILTSHAFIKKGTVITELIRSCLIDRSININEMISGDKNAIMIAIRITGYGAEYEADVQCPECEAKEKQVFQLDQLGLKRLEIEPVRPGENLFAFKLPVCGKTVAFKFLTGRDEEEILTTQQRMKKTLQSVNETNISTKLRYSIVEIDGKSDKTLINAFIAKMPARDSLMLRKFIDKNEPGVDMTQSCTCSSCNHEWEVSVPLGVSFFWPQS